MVSTKNKGLNKWLNKAQKFFINVTAFVAITGSFLYGSIYGVAGLVAVAVFYFWTASIISLFGFMDKVAEETFKKNPDVEFGLPLWLDVTFDIITLTTLVYFGYIILGIFWILHIIGMATLRENIEKLRNGDALDV